MLYEAWELCGIGTGPVVVILYWPFVMLLCWCMCAFSWLSIVFHQEIQFTLEQAMKAQREVEV
jgi:hypothetical protein